MTVIWTLFRKDLLRARRNYWSFVVSLAMPLFITGIIGVIFGPSSSGKGIPRIKVAIVDEDGSVLADFLRNAFNRGGDGDQPRYFEPVITDREEAMQLIEGNEISAVMVIPNNFAASYLSGQKPPALELIKNPAQSFMPAIVEELLGVVVEGLNAAHQNLMSEFPAIVETFENREMPDFRKLSEVVEQVGAKFEQAEHYVFPPLITYEKETVAKIASETQPIRRDFNIFGFILPGLAAMFLLFLADGAVLELYREREFRTLERVRTLHPSLLPFVISKGIYAVVLLLISAAIMFGMGGAFFRIQWQQPLQLFVLIFCYSVFSVGFVSVIASFMKTQTRAAILNSMIIMLMAFVGGSMMPSHTLPDILGKHISPWFPNYWFAEAVKVVQFSIEGPSWIYSSARLLVLGIILLGIAAHLFNRVLMEGQR